MTPNGAATRTAAQYLVSFIAGGFLAEAWNIIVSNHQIDPTTQGLITLVIVFLVSKVQNNVEEQGTDIPGLTKLKRNDVG